jgi:sulfur relay (sulfurtransferase) complex TusBCD TusD component (DsrE family)
MSEKALQMNASRTLSEEGEIPSTLFFMEDIVGRVSVRGKPTHRDVSLPADLLQRRQQCGLVTSGLAIFGRRSENKKWLEPKIERLNLENEG